MWADVQHAWVRGILCPVRKVQNGAVVFITLNILV